MKRISFSSVTAVFAASFFALSAASGQASIPKPYALGVFAGASMPIGDFKDLADVGFHVGAFGSTTLSGNLSVRLDAAYNDFGKKDVPFTDGVATYGTKVVYTTIDAEYSLGTQTEMASGGGALPYISGGAGFYHMNYDDSCTGAGCAGLDFGKFSETRWGINAGAGADFFLSGLLPFVDIRFHSIFPKNGETRSNMILASFGLKF